MAFGSLVYDSDEAVKLTWYEGPFAVENIDARRPMFYIEPDAEKGGKARRLPLTPDFVDLLRGIPEEKRVGFVFPIPGKKVTRLKSTRDIGRRISEAGEAAGIRVNDSKYASAHDLRRAFAVRWAPRVTQTVLCELMRHESIESVKQYYLGQAAEATADAVWLGWSKTHVGEEESSQGV